MSGIRKLQERLQLGADLGGSETNQFDALSDMKI